MGQALYRKHRPKKLSEVVGQEHITRTLEQAIKNGRISHAYLFTGPRGVGKTSIARIVAHEINGLPYTDDAMHIDIIEIDAASNRRIDEIRELREKVYVAPTQAKYKIYIIDEVHMLTREAFNALLKTLEEPPEHVVFILATTDAHKLPETIISRTQRFTFRPVEHEKVVAHLKTIAKREKIQASDEALDLLADHGEGSFRDSISLLDQAAGQSSKIELADIQELLGIPPATAIKSLLSQLENGAAKAVLIELHNLYEQGFRATGIAKQLAERLRQQIMEGNLALPRSNLLILLERLLEVPVSHDPERLLEIVLLESLPDDVMRPTRVISAVKAAPSKSTPPPGKPAAANAVPASKHETAAPSATPVDIMKEPEAAPAHTGADQPFDLKLWPEVLAALKKKHNTVYSIVRMGTPSIGLDGRLIVAFAFAFHQKRLNDAKNRQLLSDTIRELTGNTVGIECVFDKNLAQSVPAGAPPAEHPADAPALDAISSIFGGGELLES